MLFRLRIHGDGPKRAGAHAFGKARGLVGRQMDGTSHKDVCRLCGLHHDDIAGPGRALRRKYLVRPHTALAMGAVPVGARRLLASLKLPPGVKRITKVELS